ncbi:hypothetical protein [Desulfobulbus rhabdoformis]|uniref:hypothetical protein n=1 Tax=Desulfobulbus rhabdoformis TaxID=34032 RepID=UPI0019667437|nr:hypothetical protein [Desulfobulbus rhabdoformis]
MAYIYRETECKKNIAHYLAVVSLLFTANTFLGNKMGNKAEKKLEVSKKGK